MLEESEQHSKRIKMEYNSLPPESISRHSLPSPDHVTVADAMLKLSAVPPKILPTFVINGFSGPGGAGVGGDDRSPGMMSSSHQQMLSHEDCTNSDSMSGNEHNSQDSLSRNTRKQREFIPEFKKDDHYWVKRRKNNEAAKRSREKRRMNDVAMGDEILKLTNEKTVIQNELEAIKKHYGLPAAQTFVSSGGAPSVGNKTSLMDHQTHTTDVASLPLPTPGSVIQINSMTSHHLDSQFSPEEAASAQPQHAAPTMVAHYQPRVEEAEDPLFSRCTQQAQQSEMPMLIPMPPALTTLNFSPRKTNLIHVPNSSANVATTSLGPVGSSPTQEGTGVHSIPSTSPYPASPPTSGSSSPHSLKISLSGNRSDSDDDSSPEQSQDMLPLNLSRRSGDSYSNNLNHHQDLPPAVASVDWAREWSGIPHKLRHKLSNTDGMRSGIQIPGSNQGSFYQFASQPRVTSSQEIDPAQELEEEVYPDSQSASGAVDGKPHSRYFERRRRNNMAARKCRENRRLITDMRMAKSNLLEVENDRLKDEIQSLAVEITSLRNMLTMKKEPLANGEKASLLTPEEASADSMDSLPRQPDKH